MFRLRMIGRILKASGLGATTLIFLVLFFVCAFIINVLEPGMANIGDALWFCFQVVTTIGLGDYTAVTFAGRIVTVVLSVISVFFLAVLTGAVVSYCQESMRANRDASVAHFLDQLEHLPELNKEELTNLSDKIKKFKNE